MCRQQKYGWHKITDSSESGSALSDTSVSGEETDLSIGTAEFLIILRITLFLSLRRMFQRDMTLLMMMKKANAT
jgi:hypothetical protein